MRSNADKYSDNKLAEEFDWIVLTDATHEERGLPQGTLGTLIRSYSGSGAPLYGEFVSPQGIRQEEALALDDFRVVNVKSEKDFPLVLRYLKRRFCRKEAK